MGEKESFIFRYVSEFKIPEVGHAHTKTGHGYELKPAEVDIILSAYIYVHRQSRGNIRDQRNLDTEQGPEAEEPTGHGLSCSDKNGLVFLPQRPLGQMYVRCGVHAEAGHLLQLIPDLRLGPGVDDLSHRHFIADLFDHDKPVFTSQGFSGLQDLPGNDHVLVPGFQPQIPAQLYYDFTAPHFDDACLELELGDLADLKGQLSRLYPRKLERRCDLPLH